MPSDRYHLSSAPHLRRRQEAIEEAIQSQASSPERLATIMGRSPRNPQVGRLRLPVIRCVVRVMCLWCHASVDLAFLCAVPMGKFGCVGPPRHGATSRGHCRHDSKKPHSEMPELSSSQPRKTYTMSDSRESPWPGVGAACIRGENRGLDRAPEAPRPGLQPSCVCFSTGGVRRAPAASREHGPGRQRPAAGACAVYTGAPGPTYWFITLVYIITLVFHITLQLLVCLCTWACVLAAGVLARQRGSHARRAAGMQQDAVRRRDVPGFRRKKERKIYAKIYVNEDHRSLTCRAFVAWRRRTAPRARWRRSGCFTERCDWRLR